MFLYHPEHRKIIINAFETIFKEEKLTFDAIAGTSTAGIPWAAILADKLGKPMIYIRDKPKDHGLKNQIEGIDAEKAIFPIFTGMSLIDLFPYTYKCTVRPTEEEH